MSLIAHYNLNGNAKDLLGNDGTAIGVTWVDGKVGKAALLSASSSRIITNQLIPHGNFSYAFWHYSDPNIGSSTWRTLLGTDSNIHPLICQNKISLGVWDGGFKSFGYNFPTLNWTHIVINYNISNGTASLFVNGVYYSNNSHGYKPTNYPITTIGNAKGQSYSCGYLDDVRIYDHILSEKEVLDLSRGLNGWYRLNKKESYTDSTGNFPEGVIGSVVPTFIDTTPIGISAFRFNKNTYINTNQTFKFEKSDSFSGCFWINPDDHSTGASAAAGIFGKGHWYDNTWDIYIQNNNSINFEISGNATRSGITTINMSMTVGAWVHIAFTYNNGTMKLYKNGVLITSGSYAGIGGFTNENPVRIGQRHTDTSRRFGGELADIRLYASELTDTDVKELYQTGLSVDNQGRMHSAYLNESGIVNPNMLDYTTWVAGTTGNATGFSVNGSAAENHRITDVDPFGKSITVWEARPDATSGADGGWNGTYYNVDTTKMHRLSVWIRRPVIGNGSTYLGTHGETAAVLNRSNEASNSNPYFFSGGWSATEWRLVVGHVWPVGSGTGSSYIDSGIYDVNGNKIQSTGDFVCAAGTTSLHHRSYLYYSTNTTTRQQWCYPRMDVCDGTEPSIEALITGFDSLNYDRTHDELGSTSVPDHFGVDRAKTNVGQFSEVGISRGLVSWFPLKGDTKDRVSNEVATNIGAVATADGYSFETTTAEITSPTPDWSGNMSHSISAWVYIRSVGTSRTGILTTQPQSTGAHHWLLGNSGSIHMGCWSGSISTSLSSGDFPLNTWFQLTATFDLPNLILIIYVDGVEATRQTATSSNFNLSPGIILGHGVSTENSFDGKLKLVKTFNDTLTPEEVAQEYQSSSKSMINKSTAFAKEFIES